MLFPARNYYTVLLTEDTNVYKNDNDRAVVVTIPKDTQVYLSNKANKKNYKKIKWGEYLGWAYNPSYSSYSSYIPLKTSNSSTGYYNSSSSSKGSGGTVNVKGYYRKNGTYVSPHTRSAPRRR